MKKVGGLRNRKSERGQTIALVAVAITALLAMAALAIDVVSLYVARAETQRAADAAALAGAKMFVNSGVTSLSGGGPVTLGDVCASGGAGSPQAANREAEAVAQQNLIAGQAPTVQTITCTLGEQRNPEITVTVQSANLPGFFSRIWNRPGNIVRATATAEAYNSSGFNAPVQAQAVKPWLLPNCYSGPGSWGTATCASAPKFINSDGTINSGSSFLGQTIELTQINCGAGGTPGANGCGVVPNTGFFYSLQIPENSGPPVCPSPDANWSGCDFSPDGHDYSENIACANPQTIACGQTIGGGGPTSVWADGTASTNTRATRHATRCLIHADADDLDQGQDQFCGGGFGGCNKPTTLPVTIRGDYNNPDNTMANGRNISRSDSVVTVPLYDGNAALCTTTGNCAAAAPTIVGFLQLGITCSVDAPGGEQGCADKTGHSNPEVEAVILNAVGCAPGAPGTPVTGTGTSPVAVRLIH